MQSRGDKTRVVCSRGRTRSSFSRLASCTPPSPSRACARDSYGRWEEKIARVRARAEISRRRRPATRRPLSSPARRATVDFRQSGRSPARAPLRHATMNDSCEALKASPLRSQVCSPPRRREATSTVLRSNASPIGMIVDRSLQLREHNSARFRSGLSGIAAAIEIAEIWRSHAVDASSLVTRYVYYLLSAGGRSNGPPRLAESPRIADIDPEASGVGMRGAVGCSERREGKSEGRERN